jgi:hypothetical protein
MARSMAQAPKTWILTGSPENFDATREHGFRLIGMKERRRDGLEHVPKWPAEHWRLAFQGQLRTISEADAGLLLDRMRSAAGTPA